MPYRQKAAPQYQRLKVVKMTKPIAPGFTGMNWFAAKELNIPFPYGKDTVTAKTKWEQEHEML